MQTGEQGTYAALCRSAAVQAFGSDCIILMTVARKLMKKKDEVYKVPQ